MSEIVETQAGFHIIQLIARRGEYVNVRHILLMTKVSPYALEKAKTELDSIAQLIRDEKISFEEAVEQFSQDEGKVNGGYLVNPYTGGIRFDTETLDPQVAFVIDKLEVNDISEPVPMKTEDGKDAYRLLKLKVKTNPHQANLKDDYNRIQQWALQDKQQQAVDKWTIKKSKNAFISISENYKDCPFSFDWKGQE